MDIIKSPLNYTGNKYRIFNQMSVYFPEKIDFMVDMFCGGATVGINVECKKRLFIDSNKRVIGLLKFLSSSNYENLLNDLIELINKYKLSNSYEKGFAYYKNIANDKNVNNGLKKYNEVGYLLTSHRITTQ